MIDTLAPGPAYYHFLAGLGRCFGFTRILEIGTHWGGATRAMRHGIGAAPGTVVTVDVTTESDNRLKAYPEIRKVVGDANSEAAFAAVIEHFERRPIDLLYIDALHLAWPSFLNHAIYATVLRPKLVVFDDIALNAEMARMWSWLRDLAPPGEAINAAAVVPAIRAKPGFGLLRLGRPPG
jgi:predicted O-methyltransferase YrrM